MPCAIDGPAMAAEDICQRTQCQSTPTSKLLVPCAIDGPAMAAEDICQRTQNQITPTSKLLGLRAVDEPATTTREDFCQSTHTSK